MFIHTPWPDFSVQCQVQFNRAADFNLKNAVDKHLEVFEGLVHVTEKGIDLDNSLPENFTMHNDEELFTQVFGNLVSNSLRYCPKNKSVSIGLRKTGDNLVEVKGGNHLNTSSYRHDLTEKGVEQARKAWERNRYVGPCPVTLEQYAAILKTQATRRARVGRDEVVRAVRHLVLSPEIVDCIGPAVNSFRSLLIYGPPGNGKTSLAKSISSHLLGGEVRVPYARFADGQVIKVYDVETHAALDEPEAEHPGQPKL